jgi:Mg-chelatase subunit ChlD
METPLTSRNRRLLPTASDHYREELFMSPEDSVLTNMNDDDCAVLRVKNIVPEVSARQEAVRIRIEKHGAFQEKTLRLNSLFFDELKLSPGQEWELLRVSDSQLIKEITIEPIPVNSFAKNELAQMSRSGFNGRCLLIEPGNTGQDILLRMGRGRFFKVRELRPTPDLRSQTILQIEPTTHLDVYLPGVEHGRDLVLIVDASKSMKLKDYEETEGHLVTRIEAAKRVVELLLDWYFVTSSPRSRLGMVAFGNDARIAYPEAPGGLAPISKTQAKTLCREIPGLPKRIDNTGSNLIEALKSTESLLENTVNQNNNRLLILISDGAYWGGQDLAGMRYVAQNSAENASVATFISKFYERRRIGIHTIAIGTEEEIRKFEPKYYRDDLSRPEDKRVQIPNPKVLKQISELTNGRFTTIDDIDSFRDLFEGLTGMTMEFS